jgi:hypothetical protein
MIWGYPANVTNGHWNRTGKGLYHRAMMGLLLPLDDDNIYLT